MSVVRRLLSLSISPGSSVCLSKHSVFRQPMPAEQPPKPQRPLAYQSRWANSENLPPLPLDDGGGGNWSSMHISHCICSPPGEEQVKG
ncbi:hypothetical protein Q8A67_019467 [Cirrhinus molitorella]|uniref:Uncharacterized protein n=1 Tax=Cirrhinus molitorella TaxID=172907 RepID=A0AA88PCG2_9TELE|nr:hypothetical protein Q8A67_019467 [Cirrhinus molitorella]